MDYNLIPIILDLNNYLILFLYILILQLGQHTFVFIHFRRKISAWFNCQVIYRRLARLRGSN